MTNYYFISSPFHLFLSCNLAITNSKEMNIAIVVPRISSKFLVSDTYSRALEQAKNIFSDYISFENTDNQSAKRSKYKERKYRFNFLKAQLEKHPADRIYTGNDRRLEFQYAMSVAIKNNQKLQGIYLDEGMATYLGHKSMHSIQHKYIDPLFKKMVYGSWWKNPVTIGSSGWIDTIYAAFPKLIHPTLKEKIIKPVNHAVFDSELLKQFCKKYIEDIDISTGEIENYKILIILTHESFYPNGYSHIRDMINKAKNLVEEKYIAIKAHPRSECSSQIKSDFPECKHASHQVGFEMMLPILNKKCVVVGDVSTAVFTTRWLRPELKIIAVKIEDKKREFIHNELESLYKKIGVPMQDISSDWLS